jgi:hypothetical protein
MKNLKSFKVFENEQEKKGTPKKKNHQKRYLN